MKIRKRTLQPRQPLGPYQRSSLVPVHRRVPSHRLPALRFQAGLNTHRQKFSNRLSQGTEGQPPPQTPRLLSGHRPRAVLGDGPRTARAALSSETQESSPQAPRRPPTHTSHPSLQTSPLPHSHPRSCLLFPDMTSKQPRGSLQVLACRLPVPHGQCPRSPVFITTPPQGWATCHSRATRWL